MKSDSSPNLNLPSGSFFGRHAANCESYSQAVNAWDASHINTLDKLEAFPRFTTKRSLSRFSKTRNF